MPGRSGENSSGGLKDRCIAMWPVRTLVRLVVMVIAYSRVSRATIRSIRHRNIPYSFARELMSDAALSACRPHLDERRHRATLVTGDPLELRPGCGVENELSAQLGVVSVFQITLARTMQGSTAF
jgi:hypothetical protein